MVDKAVFNALIEDVAKQIHALMISVHILGEPGELNKEPQIAEHIRQFRERHLIK